MRRREAAVRGGRGGVKAGWRRPDRRTGAPGIIAGAGGGAGGPPHAGDGGKSGRARAYLARRGVPPRVWAAFRLGATGAVPGARAVVRLSSPGGDLGGSHSEVSDSFRVRDNSVVIPWRGFRCFTPNTEVNRSAGVRPKRSCNPLAGI